MVYDYKKPTIITIDQYRVNGESVINGENNYYLSFRIKAGGSTDVGGQQNRLHLMVERTGENQPNTFTKTMLEDGIYSTTDISGVLIGGLKNDSNPLYMANSREYRIRYTIWDDVIADMVLEKTSKIAPMGTGKLFMCMDPANESLSIGCYLQGDDRNMIRIRDDMTLRVGGQSLSSHIVKGITEYLKSYKRQVLAFLDGTDDGSGLPGYSELESRDEYQPPTPEKSGVDNM